MYNGEDTEITRLAAAVSSSKVTFGIEGDLDVTCRNYKHAGKIEFDLIVRGDNYGKVTSPLTGRYNLMNILGACAVSLEKGIEFDQLAEAMRTFRGVKRRFELVGDVRGVKVVEDYAHHPTELRAVIYAAVECNEGRVIAIFQPHRYSRTKDMMEEFAACFDSADVLILTDIYSADEPVRDVSIKELYKAMDSDKFEQMEYVKKEEIPEYVSRIARVGDMVLVLGAGDIRDISGELVEKIKSKHEKQRVSE